MSPKSSPFKTQEFPFISNFCDSHYGYWIHAAALIGHLDPSWLTAANKDYVNTLVKDVCNPITNGQFFPFSRAFDWYHGHSWAHGVTPFGDGKDQESTSEDANVAYAIKMWGKVIGDKSMEARGNLMLSILARSFQNYFLMDSANVNQPSRFIANKVTGIVSYALPPFSSVTPHCLIGDFRYCRVRPDSMCSYSKINATIQNGSRGIYMPFKGST